MNTLERDQLISFERATVVVDEYGGETSTFTELTKAWAQVRWGSGQERREAAQEQATQAATFVCDPNPTLSTVQVTDRIQFQGVAWDITGIGPIRRSQIHFTAVRAA